MSSPVPLWDHSLRQEQFRRDVITGLAEQPKHLPCKYFYDQPGCRLFQRICQLDEYYLTRVELSILHQCIFKIADRLGPRCLLMEFGSGDGCKTRILLDHAQDPVAYVPVDIARWALTQAARQLARLYPGLQILPVCADFVHPFDVPRPHREPAQRVIFFPGSTIGNFPPRPARRLLAHIRSLIQPDGMALIGIDLEKDPQILERAYNDRQGVTAQFNLNLLYRINRELTADFQPDQFEHRAFYDPQHGRIEMHLVSRCLQTVKIGDQLFTFESGETICTEYSYKYSLDQFCRMAGDAGLRVHATWTDRHRYFAVVLLDVAP